MAPPVIQVSVTVIHSWRSVLKSGTLDLMGSLGLGVQGSPPMLSYHNRIECSWSLDIISE